MVQKEGNRSDKYGWYLTLIRASSGFLGHNPIRKTSIPPHKDSRPIKEEPHPIKACRTRTQLGDNPKAGKNKLPIPGLLPSFQALYEQQYYLPPCQFCSSQSQFHSSVGRSNKSLIRGLLSSSIKEGKVPMNELLRVDEVKLEDWMYINPPSPASSKRERESNNFFHYMIISFFNYLVIPQDGSEGVFGDIESYFSTTETNGRGSLHLHGFLWLKGNIGFENLREKSIKRDS